MQKILADHGARYPEMSAQDWFKLLYQSEFGGGHLIANREMALNRLKTEIAAQTRPPVHQFEAIGGGLVRMYLPVDGLRPETALGLFLGTCSPRGSIDGIHSKLDALCSMKPELTAAAEEYRRQGCPAQSHSEGYRAAYAPAYRLAPEAAEEFFCLFQAIDRLLTEHEFVLIAIDGRCASGKTTLAALLQRVYDANLFHMDDYFLPFERKTPERLAEPGGNVDYERFFSEIASQPKGASVTWHCFDCSVQGLSAPIHTPPKRLTIVEGSYSLHPVLRDAYDLKVFLDIDPQRQSDRILRRNGPEMHARFVNEWIPLENEYFDGLNIRSIADLAFDR